MGVINFFLHSLWSQIDVFFQQKLVTSSGTNYAYKAIIDAYLNYGRDAQESQLQAALYFKDTAGPHMECTNPVVGRDFKEGDPLNVGLQNRFKYTKLSKEFDMIGVPLCDIFSLDRYLLNGVAVKIVMSQTKNSFRLMRTGTENYKVLLTDMVLKVCKVLPSPGIITAHSQMLATKTAIYPFMRADIKTFAIAQGSYSVHLDDVYQGQVPSRLVCGFVKSEAFSGSYTLNPFNFQNVEIESIICKADNQSVPSEGIKTDFTVGNYAEAYESLFIGAGIEHSDNGIFCTREEYPMGYTLFAFNLDAQVTTPSTLPALRKGNLSLEIRMKSNLTWPATLICYANFPAQLEIDHARAITL